LCVSFVSEPCQQSSNLLWQPRVSSPSLEPHAPGQTGVRLSTAAGIAWSEYNHHWAGLAVFAMGFFAFLARTGKAQWAGNWPLLFLGLGVFIIYRADPENWPLGPNGFWTSFADPEVLLHRVFAVLIITFGVFERRVQTGHVIFQRVSLVFPSIAALGSVLLLTHSHNLGSTKEEMLAEISHTLLAILGMVAGASRWLELRLPSEDRTRQIVSWLWPLCLLLIGMILWNYRES
jgi:putative copper resistance protein D